MTGSVTMITDTPVFAPSTQTLRELLESGETAILEITDTAMVPLLQPGDRVRVRAACARRLCSGDIVLVQVGNDLRCVRLLWRGFGMWWAKADAVPEFYTPATRAAIVGRVISVYDASNVERPLAPCACSALLSLLRGVLHYLRRHMTHQHVFGVRNEVRFASRHRAEK